MPSHVFVDLDQDGKKDMITFSQCAFLTSVKPADIPIDKRCAEPEMAPIGFPEGHIPAGQKVSSDDRMTWMPLVYLVKDNKDFWKLYKINGLKVSVFMLDKKGIFHAIKPTWLDEIDLVTYRVTHLGIALVLSIVIRNG